MSESVPSCGPGDHSHLANPGVEVSPKAVERAAALFRAMGDGPRLRTLILLARGPRCVTEIVESMGEKFPTVSQRLRVLRGEGLVRRHRKGNHLYYELSDRHVVDLVSNALAHAAELEVSPPAVSDEGD